MALAIRSRRESIFSQGLFSNKAMLGAVLLTVGLHLTILYVPFCNELFSTQPLTVAELGVAVAVASVVFWVVEIQKFIIRRRGVADMPPLPVVRPAPASGSPVARAA